MAENKICLNMIVKNESKIIERCIKSVYHLIDTWCIVDTGSTDGTQEIIKELLKDKPGELIERPWVNFGHNRNEALRYGEKWGDWILLTDADMVLVDEGFDKSTLNPSIDGYEVIQDNHGVRYNNYRLLRASRNWQCIGVTHEYYSPADGIKTRDLIPALWFNDISDGGSKSDKFERDIRLLEQGLIDEPNNHRYMFYLAQSYRDIQQWDKAIHWYEKCAETSTWDEEAWFAAYMVGWCMCGAGKPVQETSVALYKAWMMRPWRNEPVFQMAMEFKKAGAWDNAYQLLKVAASMDYPHRDSLFISAVLYEGASIDEFAVAAYHVGKHQEAIAATQKLLTSPYGEKNSERLNNNILYSEKALGLYNESSLNEFLQKKRSEVETKYLKEA
jgi:glycosyltransferase involved in cell wall biosynthesis